MNHLISDSSMEIIRSLAPKREERLTDETAAVAALSLPEGGKEREVWWFR